MQTPPPIDVNGSGMPPQNDAAGCQPPPTQTPPPIATNGSGVVQPPVPPDDEPPLDELLELLDEEPPPGAGPGSQPPFTQWPPPIATNGSDVVQPAPPPLDDPPELVEPPPDELLELLDEEPPLGAGPGSQPPFTQ